MSALAITFCILCQFLLVIGQLFLKHAMNGVDLTPCPWRRVIWNFAAGVGALTLWFFLWVGLMQQSALSRIFPFEGLNPALLVLGAWIFLKERLPPVAWVGVLLICVGIGLVTVS